MEPENNVETVLEAYQQSTTRKKLLLIGNYTNSFGSYLKEKYTDERIKFLGPLYHLEHLNNLRHFSHVYFHGHSVGGTNPSLLEAMASNALIVAHDNVFNRAVLENDAIYFSTVSDIIVFLNSGSKKSQYEAFIENNRKKIKQSYSWEHITNLLEKSLSDALYNRSK
jgi:glycosyltransferase involved in cell wall biosynthesis